LTAHDDEPSLQTMSLHIAHAVLNNDVDTDATPTTGWGRRRTRA
jgi:hypothetical protein